MKGRIIITMVLPFLLGTKIDGIKNISKIYTMSQAFVKENDDQWLHDLPPTLNALLVYLTRENNGISIYQKNVISDKIGRLLHSMSNGLNYAIDSEGKWEIVW